VLNVLDSICSSLLFVEKPVQSMLNYMFITKLEGHLL